MSNLSSIKSTIEHTLALKITQDFKDACKYIMDDFYASYSPSLYNRTDNLRGGTIFTGRTTRNTGGVLVDSAGVGQHKEASGEDVFDLMWNQGIRGLPAVGGSGWVNPNFMTFSASIPEFGISASSPDAAMTELIDKWDTVRQNYIDETVDKALDSLELF